MNAREYVKLAVGHVPSDKVPYAIRLTSEAIDLYGDRLLRDYHDPEVTDDYRAGLIGKAQAVYLSIGNFMVKTSFPWWNWDYENLPEAYRDPFAEPEEMPPVLREDTPENFEAMRRQSRLLSEKYGVYVPALIWGSHWEKAYFTRGIENFLADLAALPDFSRKLLTFIVGMNMEILPEIAKDPHIDGILLGSDWGTQKDLIMSPVTWDDLILPGEKRQYDLIAGAGKDVMIHSCGNILGIMDRLMALGVRILNPVQPECMDLGFLKKTYGASVTFWGGISTQRTLPYGTPGDVSRETAGIIRMMSVNGGYITCSSQEIQTDVPYENLRALIDTARSFA